MPRHKTDTNKPKHSRQKKSPLGTFMSNYTPRQIWQRSRLWQKIVEVIVVIIVVCLAGMYGIARWYIHEQSNKPLTLGVTFIPDYARYLGLDAPQTLQAMTDQLGVKNLRLVSYWDDIEPTPNQFNFTDLDWQFQMAESAHAQVLLSVGLRQPRWPECHIPSWAASEPESVWYPQLKTFMATVINRYKDSPALQGYQLENEFFLKAFGQCTNYDRSRLVDEYNYVKKLDPAHPVIVSRSNNDVGLPVGAPTPDEFAVSVYKRVYDRSITHRYFEYPFPAWFYGFLAGAGQILTGKDMIIHELQAEPWPPTTIPDASIAEQNKSMDATRLKSRFAYGEATGIRTIYLWGAEWWYYRLIIKHDSSVWNVAKQEFAQARHENFLLSLKNKH